MAARRSRASTLVHIERATPKIQGSEWSTEERKTRRLVAHVRELGWKTHTVSVVREWDLRFGRKRRRLLAHAMCFDRGGWVFSLSFDPPKKGARDDLRSSPWLQGLRGRLGDAWRLEETPGTHFYFIRAIRRPISARRLLTELAGIVAIIEERAPRPSGPAPRGEPRAALGEVCRKHGWYLESIGHERRLRIGGWPCISSVSAITRGTGEMPWFSVLLHFESGPMASDRPPEEADALVARGYRATNDGFFMLGRSLAIPDAKRELALLLRPSASRASSVRSRMRLRESY